MSRTAQEEANLAQVLAMAAPGLDALKGFLRRVRRWAGDPDLAAIVRKLRPRPPTRTACSDEEKSDANDPTCVDDAEPVRGGAR